MLIENKSLDRLISVSVSLSLFFFIIGHSAFASEPPKAHLAPRSVLKLILQHPILEPYLKPEIAGRGPLVVSDHLLAPGVTPSRFGEPVQIQNDREIGNTPHLRFRRFEPSGSRAKAVVEYVGKGVVAEFILEHRDGWWSVVEAKLAKSNSDFATIS